MTISYDYIIIGCGPTGLSLCSYLINSNKNYKICIVEKNNVPGGCNAVISNRNIPYSEHSPRIATSAYYNFKQVLKSIGLDFNDYYTRYFSFYTTSLKNISIKEFIILFFLYIVNIFYSLEKYPVEYFIQSEYIDKICRMTDGTNIKKYNVNQFLQIFNENILHNFYQQKNTNLYIDWVDKLRKLNVDFYFNEKVVFYNQNSISTSKNNIYNGKNILLAVPPASDIISNNFSPEFINNSKYMDYISIVYIWNKKLDITSKSVNSYIVWNITSDYIDFGDKTVISTILLFPEKLKGLPVDFIFSELQKDLKINSIYDKYIINNFDQTSWIKTFNVDFVQPKNLIGTFNGNSDYSFTSVESAVSNSLSYCKKIGIKNLPLFHYNYLKFNRILLMVLFILFLCFYTCK